MSCINLLSATQATGVASNALTIYQRIKPDVTAIIYFTTSIAITAIALSVYQYIEKCKTNLDEFCTHLKNKVEHAGNLVPILEELKKS